MKILVRLPNWLGDIVMGSYFIHSLQKSYEEAQIDVIVKKSLVDMAKLIPSVTEVYGYSKQEYSGIWGLISFGRMIKKKEKYDLFFSLPNSFSAAFMGYFTGSKKRVGYSFDRRAILLNDSYNRPENIHRVEEYLFLLKLFTKKKISFTNTPLQLPAESENNQKREKPYILFNINSEAQSRKIPIEKAKEIISEFQKVYDFDILLTGASADIEYTEQVINNNDKRVHNFAGKTSLLELAQLAKGALVVITTDSGLAHLSHALNTFTIVLFGAGDEKNTAPYKCDPKMIVRSDNISCAPCVENVCTEGDTPPCLTNIDTKQIIKIVQQIIMQ